MQERHRKPLVTVVSPVYGCRDCIEALAERVAVSFAGTDLEWELILVDDRSADAPWDLICNLAAEEPRIRGLLLARNHGQHLAIWAGLEASRGDWVAVVDCDLQDDPEHIPILYEKALADNVDAVVVDRGEWSDSKFRRLAANAFYKLVDRLGGISLKNSGNFGIYSRRLVNTLIEFREQEVVLPMMVALTGFQRSSLKLDRSERLSGKSTYSLFSLLALAATIIVRFSDRPLKISVVVGIAFSLMSALVSIVLVVMRLVGAITVPGWTSTVLSVWFLSGLIMATLGIHGFYISRVFAEVRARPRIIVETRTPSPCNSRKELTEATVAEQLPRALVSKS
ncbi:MAG: glycosyltransferase family 2 protein [Yoonia sp.]